MRVANWNPKRFDAELADVCMGRLRAAGEKLADIARDEVPVGNIYRPVYKSGKYAGKEWTAREPGALKSTIRVVEKWQTYSTPLAQNRNIRVYAGNKKVFYASIVEYSVKPFMRKAKRRALPAIKEALGVR